MLQRLESFAAGVLWSCAMLLHSSVAPTAHILRPLRSCDRFLIRVVLCDGCPRHDIYEAEAVIGSELKAVCASTILQWASAPAVDKVRWLRRDGLLTYFIRSCSLFSTFCETRAMYNRRDRKKCSGPILRGHLFRTFTSSHYDLDFIRCASQLRNCV